MESLTSKEFFSQLNGGTLKTPFYLKGIVKKSEKDSEVLFTRKGDFKHWAKIPSSMIDKVRVLKTFTKEEILFAVVKLQLAEPTNTEGKALYELLVCGEKAESKGKEKGGDYHYNMEGKYCKEGGEHYCHKCGCKKNCQCGCHEGHQCSCGCHHVDNCHCGCDSQKSCGK